MGLREYVDSRANDPPDLLEQVRAAIKEAAVQVSAAATMLDVLGTRCEQHQAQEDSEARQAIMEPSIQKYGGASRDLWAMQMVLRRMTTGLLHRLVQEDVQLAAAAEKLRSAEP